MVTHWGVRIYNKGCRSLSLPDTESKGPLLSVRLHSPTQGVIGIKIEHFKVSLLIVYAWNDGTQFISGLRIDTLH